jgi:predicted Zn-dependent protease
MKQLFSKLISTVLITLFLHLSCIQSIAGFSIGEERKVGEKLLYTVRTAFPLLDDPDLVQYLSSLGQEVLEVAGLQYFDYHFFIIKDDEFNAFAAPSGLVFFYSGLISSMKSEDELVSVLAHEIGHVAKRHLAGQVEKGQIIGAASIAVALAALALGGGAATQALLTGSMAVSQSANLHYSRKHEEEADLMAYGWMKDMKRNPQSQKTMLDTMRRISRYRSDKLPQYLLTHPNPEARLDYVQALLKIDEKALEALPDNDNFEFLRFKYRIMAESVESDVLRENLASIIGDKGATAYTKTMAKYGLSQLERKVNNFPRSLELLDEVIAMLPEQQILQSDRGALLYAAANYVEARAVLEKACDVNGKDMYSTFYLGKTYQALGDMGKAKTLFSTVSYSLPEYSKVYFELGKIATLQKQTSTASLHLGKYYLYEGKLKLAKFSLRGILKDKIASEHERADAESLLDMIERLEEK